MTKAIAIIEGEHRNLGALLICLKALIREIEQQHKKPDFKVFHAILNYLDTFLARYHHPKEDNCLFPTLLYRHPEAKAVIKDLGRQHRRGVALLTELRRALAAYEYEGHKAFSTFKAAALIYADFERDHAYQEEREVLPLAREYLTDEDWEEMNRAFSDHNDPLFGDARKAEYERLYHLIANMTPAPHGFGKAWQEEQS